MDATNIIGRKTEQARLNAIFTSANPEFVAVYGRRRVGKTFLIRNTFINMNCTYFQITGIQKGKTSVQLGRFKSELSEVFFDELPLETPKNWMLAFEMLTKAIKSKSSKEKVVLFFDELPWLNQPRSGVLQALEYFWNQHWSNMANVKLVVCGSSASFIIKKIIKGKGGFHNRVTEKLLLKPFNLHDTKLYLEHLGINYNQTQLTMIYMILGGIPFYLKQLKKQLSIDQNINQLLFQKDSTLFNEFDDVFASLFKKSDQYKEIVYTIAKHKDGLPRTQLEKLLTQTTKGSQLTIRLEDLEYAGFISSYMPYGKSQRGLIYRINDEFCYFYATWVHQIKAQLKQNDEIDYWSTCKNQANYYHWSGYAFENLCFKHLNNIRKGLNIPLASLASPWRTTGNIATNIRGAQIDLLFDRPDDAITICEIKYTSKPYRITKDYAHILENKKHTFAKTTNTAKQLFLAVISASGIENNYYADELIDASISLDDLLSN